ncbi:MAG TPA: DHHA1 domain-containing protein [Candidatus Nanoarchaeia archaeon]|nr:DHHA1 domain-containing protein [Candidatus Nanoarchaeia archaeon]
MVTILPKKQLDELRTALKSAKKPLFFYDSDADGLCSFLVLYRLYREGKGIIVKSTSYLDKNWVNQAEKYQPDAVFILDMPCVEQNFIDGVHSSLGKIPIYWIDHHTPLDRASVKYFNPRIKKSDAYIPTTRIAYEIVKTESKNDMWIAAIGCVADWYVPDFKRELIKYPSLLPSSTTEPEVAMFDTVAGKLARIVSFILKGKTNEVLKCINALIEIKSPEELLNTSTAAARKVMDYYGKVNKNYEPILADALKTTPEDGLLLFRYDEDRWSFSSDLSNEVAHHFPTCIILIARRKNDEYKCSLRSRKIPIAPVLQKALVGVRGRGGGHEYACGAVINVDDFDRFVGNFKRELGG